MKDHTTVGNMENEVSISDTKVNIRNIKTTAMSMNRKRNMDLEEARPVIGSGTDSKPAGNNCGKNVSFIGVVYERYSTSVSFTLKMDTVCVLDFDLHSRNFSSSKQIDPKVFYLSLTLTFNPPMHNGLCK